jgi:carbon-monoxide dehydrogenase large subunit
VGVEIEELPAVVHVIDGVPTTPLVHEHFGDNIAYKLTSGEGDIEAAMKAADRIVSQKMVHQRLAPIAMEPRGVLARYFPAKRSSLCGHRRRFHTYCAHSWR